MHLNVQLLTVLQQLIEKAYPNYRHSFAFKRLLERLKPTTQLFFDHHDYDTNRERTELRFYQGIWGLLQVTFDLADANQVKRVTKALTKVPQRQRKSEV